MSAYDASIEFFRVEWPWEGRKAGACRPVVTFLSKIV